MPDSNWPVNQSVGVELLYFGPNSAFLVMLDYYTLLIAKLMKERPLSRASATAIKFRIASANHCNIRMVSVHHYNQ